MKIQFSNAGRFFLLAGAILLFGSACQRAQSVSSTEALTAHLVQVGDPMVQKDIGEESQKFSVMGSGSFAQRLQSGELVLADSALGRSFLKSLSVSGGEGLAEDVSASARENFGRAPGPADQSLWVGFPVGLLGQQQVFGAVITQVSDKKSEDLGRLKLTDLPPVHVQGLVAPLGGGKYGLGLFGCVSDCDESSEQEAILALPIRAVDQKKGEVILDLSSIGSQLDFLSMLDPEGKYTNLKTKSARTTTVDYSISTLVFDVETRMIPLESEVTDPSAPETVFVTRWYLKLGSAFNSAFQPRKATPGVGFFMTERGKENLITRWSTSGIKDVPPVKYYLKNIPAEFQKAFSTCFDEWNEKLLPVLGKKLLAYEFIPAGDPKNNLIVTGDIRYNVVEWDLINVAPYGGLGPSIANQLTGEMLSANVLIQGPLIVTMYQEWFKKNREVANLIESGHHEMASSVLARTEKALSEKLKQLEAAPRFQLKLGKKLVFRVNAQRPGLEDPIMQAEGFDAVPKDVTWESYMSGYFHEMLTHELGHNLGLRHNFYGSLAATDMTAPGGVSSSIMEYLNRLYRHLNHIGNYDVMAMQYGYRGEMPKVLDGFCTDENVPMLGALDGSAECSRDDATTDPYSFFENRLVKAVDYLVARGQKTAPTWSVTDMARELNGAVMGVGMYAATGEKSGATWKRFFDKPGRPSEPSEVQSWVGMRLRGILCDSSLQAEVELKETPEAKAKVSTNITALRTQVDKLLRPLGVFKQGELKCKEEE